MIAIPSRYGCGELVNHSLLELNVQLPVTIGSRTLLEIGLDSSAGTLHRQLIEQGLQKIRGEVRWVQAEEKTFVDQVRFLELEPRQSELIMELLCQYGLK